MGMTIAERVTALDTDLFATVESQTTENDRRSLLAVHAAVASRYGQFSYLEIGSHLGGTLQAFLADPRCTRVVSIDPRPTWQPDDRAELDGWTYENNSTERMTGLLSGVPGVDLEKLETVDDSTENLAPERLGRPDLCFIDGEHTRAAALRDARFCRAVTRGGGVLVFHDTTVIAPAILDFLRETPGRHGAYWLNTTVFVVELDGATMLRDKSVRQQLHHLPQVWATANRFGRGESVLWAMMAAHRLSDHRQRGSSRA